MDVVQVICDAELGRSPGRSEQGEGAKSFDIEFDTAMLRMPCDATPTDPAPIPPNCAAPPVQLPDKACCMDLRELLHGEVQQQRVWTFGATSSGGSSHASSAGGSTIPREPLPVIDGVVFHSCSAGGDPGITHTPAQPQHACACTSKPRLPALKHPPCCSPRAPRHPTQATTTVLRLRTAAACSHGARTI